MIVYPVDRVDHIEDDNARLDGTCLTKLNKDTHAGEQTEAHLSIASEFVTGT